MRSRLWDQDWFEDPVWRKDRINSINAHFITAFLDRHVQDDVSQEGVPEESRGGSRAAAGKGCTARELIRVRCGRCVPCSTDPGG